MAQVKEVFSLPLKAWIKDFKHVKLDDLPTDKAGSYVLLWTQDKKEKVHKSKYYSMLQDWQKAQFETGKSNCSVFQTKAGHVILLKVPSTDDAVESHYGLLQSSEYEASRDALGSKMPMIDSQEGEWVGVDLSFLRKDAKMGALVGLELSRYRYISSESTPKNLFLLGAKENEVEEAAHLSLGVNLARHFVNTPATDLNPKTYADAVKNIFKGKKGAKVQVLHGDDLAKEKMGLLEAVGRSAEESSRLVHIRYRPAKAKFAKPLAFVGKGVTFDTGGLDLKPSSGMRLMKKDMGGSASVLGLAFWAVTSGLPLNCDFYIALAENGVGPKAFKPGDIVTGRNGMRVEIHNTDAEGRLVLADAMSYALSRKEEPGALFDVATLTGAMRIALGKGPAGMLSNNDALADLVLESGQEMGDRTWRMPLIREYEDLLKSSFADFTNAAPGGFGGGITAALFLQKFIGNTKWVHVDMMAWNDGPKGALIQAGGSGQMVQALSRTLQKLRVSHLK